MFGTIAAPFAMSVPTVPADKAGLVPMKVSLEMFVWVRGRLNPAQSTPSPN